MIDPVDHVIVSDAFPQEVTKISIEIEFSEISLQI